MTAEPAGIASEMEAEGEITPFIDEPWAPRLMTLEVGLPTSAAALGIGTLGWWLTSGTAVILPVLTGALCAVLVVLAVIDMMTQRLPDAIVLPMYPALGAGLTAAAVLGEISWGQLLAGAACMAGGYILLWLVCFFTGGMGWGDVKLAGILGLALGVAGPWDAVYGALLLPMMLGGLIAVPLLFKGGGKMEIPFGPFMVAGAIPVLMMPGALAPMLMDLFR